MMKTMSSRTVAGAGILVALAAGASAAAQGKPVIAIGQLGVAAQNISCEGWDRSIYDCNQYLAEGFRAMLETAIIKSGKMDVMEREQIDAVITEQALGEMGLTTAGGQIGGLTGVDYYVYGTITRFGASASGFEVSGGSGIGRLANRRSRGLLGSGVSKSSVETEMGVDLKVTDVATGHIVIADAVSSSVQQGSSFSIGGIRRGEVSGDPFADVQEIVAARIAEAIVTSRIPIKVIQVQSDGTLILNYGEVFFAPGDRLAAFSVGEAIVDPDTGEVLGAEETPAGMVEITRVEPRFSRAIPVGDGSLIGQGTTLKRMVADSSGQNGDRKRSGARWRNR